MTKRAQHTVKTPFSVKQRTTLRKPTKSRMHEAYGPNLTVRKGLFGFLKGGKK